MLNAKRVYNANLTASINIKGVLDIDTVKGCKYGMAAHESGCYGLCYANRAAQCRGIDFSKSISRQPRNENEKVIEKAVSSHNLSWFRIGTMGDPSHDWALTLYVAEWLSKYRTPVIVTKHWIEAPARMLQRFAVIGAIFNTSISALDSKIERDYRVSQFYRIRSYGIKSYLRIVTAQFGKTEYAQHKALIQSWLMMHTPIIDTPLRIPQNDVRVKDGTIIQEMLPDLNSKTSISRWDKDVYVGHCKSCPDQCGAKSEG